MGNPSTIRTRTSPAWMARTPFHSVVSTMITVTAQMVLTNQELLRVPRVDTFATISDSSRCTFHHQESTMAYAIAVMVVTSTTAMLSASMSARSYVKQIKNREKL